MDLALKLLLQRLFPQRPIYRGLCSALPSTVVKCSISLARWRPSRAGDKLYYFVGLLPLALFSFPAVFFGSDFAEFHIFRPEQCYGATPAASACLDVNKFSSNVGPLGTE